MRLQEAEGSGGQPCFDVPVENGRLRRHRRGRLRGQSEIRRRGVTRGGLERESRLSTPTGLPLRPSSPGGRPARRPQHTQPDRPPLIRSLRID
jgi:hypothetical protein